jgi:anti-sigma factor RsiW
MIRTIRVERFADEIIPKLSKSRIQAANEGHTGSRSRGAREVTRASASRQGYAMSTESQRLLLSAYLDGELDSASAVAIRAQIESNAKLAAELAGATALQRVVRARFPREPLPPPLRRRINTALGCNARWSRPSWTALAASVLLAVSLSSSATSFVTWLAWRAPAENHVLAAVVDSHMRSLIASRPTEVSTSERHVIKPWFNGRIPQAPRVVDLAAQGFPLLGARIDVIATAPVPTLVYTRRLHTISLVALSGASIQVAKARTESGYNVASWIDGKTSYVATSDLNAEELNLFATLFRAASAE